VVARKEVKSDNVTQFTFQPTDGLPVSSYLPGQYTTVWLHPSEWENRQPRHYTLVDGTENEYSIAVKKEPHGLVSGYLHDRTSEGDSITLSPPFGNFNLANAQNVWINDLSHPVVLLSAGVGITPAMSMLGSMKHQSERKIIWMHAAKNGHEHPFRSYLVDLGAKNEDHFKRRVWYENAKADDIKGTDNSALYHFDGLMNLGNVKDDLPLNDQHAMYFFCGPKDWMRSVAHQLMDLGVGKSQLSFEVFGPAQEILE